MRINRKTLQHYLKIAKHIAPKAGPVPSFNDLRIEPRALRVSSFEHTLELVVDAGLEILVNLRKFDASVKASGKSKDVRIEITEGQLTVTGDIAINVELSENEADRIEHINYGELLKDWQYVDGLDKALVHHAQFVAANPSRYALTGVYLDNTHIAATNGAFMCFDEIPNNLNVGRYGRIISTKACELAKYFEAYKADDLYFHQKIEGLVLSSRLVDGTFPKFLDVVPKTTETYVINNEIDTIMKKYGGGKFGISFENGRIEIFGEGDDCDEDGNKQLTVKICNQTCECPKLGMFDQKLLIPCLAKKGRNEIKYRKNKDCRHSIVIDNINGTHVIAPIARK